METKAKTTLLFTVRRNVCVGESILVKWNYVEPLYRAGASNNIYICLAVECIWRARGKMTKQITCVVIAKLF